MFVLYHFLAAPFSCVRIFLRENRLADLAVAADDDHGRGPGVEPQLDALAAQEHPKTQDAAKRRRHVHLATFLAQRLYATVQHERHIGIVAWLPHDVEHDEEVAGHIAGAWPEIVRIRHLAVAHHLD